MGLGGFTSVIFGGGGTGTGFCGFFLLPGSIKDVSTLSGTLDALDLLTGSQVAVLGGVLVGCGEFR